MKQIKLFISLAIAMMTTVNIHAQNEALKLIREVVDAAGGADKLRSLQDVEYEYTFMSKEKGIKDISTERYIFDGEYSYAQYAQREYYALPQMEGQLIQYYDGQATASFINNKKITEEQPAYVGHFFRKTNYYWFTMIYKLLDPGINYTLFEDRQVDGISYKVVQMTFDQGIGETSDKYIFYINPRTKLIDQFLFTVMGFGFSEPFLMKMRYEEIEGLKLSTHREYAPANWEGQVIKKEWNVQLSKKIKFNNGFTTTSIKNL